MITQTLPFYSPHDGQLCTIDRAMLASAVIDFRPRLAIEIGTWMGGGSTWQTANALRHNGCGHLHTCEINPSHFDVAKSIYADESWAKWLTLHFKPSTQLINELLDAQQVPDFAFLDGSEEPDECFDDFKLLEARMLRGAIVCLHDWTVQHPGDSSLSNKCKTLRPYIEGDNGWKVLKQFNKADPGYEGVGIAVAIKL